jgi:hypothetical protein
MLVQKRLSMIGMELGSVGGTAQQVLVIYM